MFSDIILFNNFGIHIFCALSASFIFSFIFTKKYIKFFANNDSLIQPIRNSGPKSHQKKIGTPTMGGIFIILATLFSTALFADFTNYYIKILSLVFVAFAIIGLVDDLIKIIYKNPQGLRGSIKIILQFAIIGLAFLALKEINPIHGYNAIFFAIGDGYFLEIASWLFILFISFVVIGSANGTNLTDGLDGLVSIPAILSLISLIILTYIASNHSLANVIRVPFIQDSQEIIIFCTSLIGAIIGFLVFNLRPAKIFMGDVGSLAIGAVLGLIAVILKQEFIFFFIALLFVVESLSVILQVASYKIQKKRIFLMAPIHHHFEKKGWAEEKVVKYFWLLSLIFMIIGLSIYFFA